MCPNRALIVSLMVESKGDWWDGVTLGTRCDEIEFAFGCPHSVWVTVGQAIEPARRQRALNSPGRSWTS
jgi:hypothetical protein